jgi:hypothetical protein
VFIISGCSNIIYKPQPCYNFKIIEQPKKRQIRVNKEDIDKYIAYIKEFRDRLSFYEYQIKLYRILCEDKLP